MLVCERDATTNLSATKQPRSWQRSDVTAQSVQAELRAEEVVEVEALGLDAAAFASWLATRDGSPWWSAVGAVMELLQQGGSTADVRQTRSRINSRGLEGFAVVNQKLGGCFRCCCSRVRDGLMITVTAPAEPTGNKGEMAK